MKKCATPRHRERILARFQAEFTALRGEAGAAERQALINTLPVVEWKGRELRQLRCTGETGRGPHLVNVDETLLWVLIDPARYRCPFHA